METIQQIIESGRLEQYALGELSPAEQAEVEGWAARYPEVQAELTALQAGLGLYAEAHALTPPAGMRERVLGRVFAEIGQPQAAVALATAAPVAPLAGTATPLTATPPAEASPLRVSASNPHLGSQPVAAAAPTRAGRPGAWAIAASVLLVLSLGANGLLYGRWQQASAALVAMQDDQARLAGRSRVLQARYDDSRRQLRVLRSPDEYRLVALAGTPAHPQARARVLYGRTDHRVYLDVQQLPPLPAGKQYQLWALYQGKPIDAGLLAAGPAAADGLQQMKDVAHAQAFAMTVEPVGGSAGPHLETLTVIGNI